MYVPAVNWTLFAAVIALVVGFRSSSHLASAYGLAVTGTLTIDTILFFVVVHALWRKPLWLTLTGAALLLVVDLAFFGANLTKLLHGGWVPIAISLLVFTLLSTWRRGRLLALARTRETEVPVEQFLEQIAASLPQRVAGTAVFLTASGGGAPPALLHNLEHNHVLHEHVILLTVRTRHVPQIPAGDRLTVNAVGGGLYQLHAEYGFQQQPDIPGAPRPCPRARRPGSTRTRPPTS